MNPVASGEMKQWKGDKHLKANKLPSTVVKGSSHVSLNICKVSGMITSDGAFFNKKKNGRAGIWMQSVWFNGHAPNHYIHRKTEPVYINKHSEKHFNRKSHVTVVL